MATTTDSMKSKPVNETKTLWQQMTMAQHGIQRHSMLRAVTIIYLPLVRSSSGSPSAVEWNPSTQAVCGALTSAESARRCICSQKTKAKAKVKLQRPKTETKFKTRKCKQTAILESDNNTRMVQDLFGKSGLKHETTPSITVNKFHRNYVNPIILTQRVAGGRQNWCTNP